MGEIVPVTATLAKWAGPPLAKLTIEKGGPYAIREGGKLLSWWRKRKTFKQIEKDASAVSKDDWIEAYPIVSTNASESLRVDRDGVGDVTFRLRVRVVPNIAVALLKVHVEWTVRDTSTQESVRGEKDFDDLGTKYIYNVEDILVRAEVPQATFAGWGENPREGTRNAVVLAVMGHTIISPPTKSGEPIRNDFEGNCWIPIQHFGPPSEIVAP